VQKEQNECHHPWNRNCRHQHQQRHFLARAGKFKFCNRNFSPLVLLTFIQNSAFLVVFSAFSFGLLFVASKKSINEAARIRCNDTGGNRENPERS
jgi:hypothetical protein